jgi:hypothetical protein
MQESTHARDRRQAKAARIAAIRPLVVWRDGGCRFPLEARASFPCAGPLAMDEFRSRQQLRGQPVEVVYSLENCWTLCERHHRWKHHDRPAAWPKLVITPLEETVNGPVRWAVCLPDGGLALLGETAPRHAVAPSALAGL